MSRMAVYAQYSMNLLCVGHYTISPSKFAQQCTHEITWDVTDEINKIYETHFCFDSTDHMAFIPEQP